MKPSEIIWKQIDGYSNYHISNNGIVKTTNFNHTGTHRLIKVFINIYGYPAVNLMERGERKRWLVHRLVAEAFIPNDTNKETVNHKDGNKRNNHISNLEWMSVEDNLKHGHASGFVKYSKGEGHYQSKVPTKDIIEIRKLIGSGMKGRDIASKFGVHEKYISAIKHFKTRKYETI